MDQRVTSLQERLAARRDMYAPGGSASATANSNSTNGAATGYNSSRATPGRQNLELVGTRGGRVGELWDNIAYFWLA